MALDAISSGRVSPWSDIFDELALVLFFIELADEVDYPQAWWVGDVSPDCPLFSGADSRRIRGWWWVESGWCPFSNTGLRVLALGFKEAKNKQTNWDV